MDTTIRIPEPLQAAIRVYQEVKGDERFAIAARRLIRLGLEAEKKAAEVSRT